MEAAGCPGAETADLAETGEIPGLRRFGPETADAARSMETMVSGAAMVETCEFHSLTLEMVVRGTHRGQVVRTTWSRLEAVEEAQVPFPAGTEMGETYCQAKVMSRTRPANPGNPVMARLLLRPVIRIRLTSAAEPWSVSSP